MFRFRFARAWRRCPPKVCRIAPAFPASAKDDFFAVFPYVVRRVARIDDQTRVADNSRVVVTGIVSRNHHGIVIRQGLRRGFHVGKPKVVAARLRQAGEMRIGVNRGTAPSAV